jgi:DNA polymerase III subunit delta'
VVDVLDINRDDLPHETDRFGDAPHPREVLWWGGDRAVETQLLEAYRSGRLHHAWMLVGQEGIGKATLAYRFARFILANPDPAQPAVQEAQDLSVPANHPVTGQVGRQSHPDLSVIRIGLTKEGKPKTETSVEDVLAALSIFRTTAGAGGWRVVIIDAVDDLNRSSANALLKQLEEPPERAIFLLVTHRPGAVLPTIRSRCRVLRLAPLPDKVVGEGLVRLGMTQAGDDMSDAVAAAKGSLRDAIAALDEDCALVRRHIATLLGSDRASPSAVTKLADMTAGRAGETHFQTMITLVEQHLADGLRATGDPAALAARAELWDKLRRSARDIEAYNLDRRPFVLSLFSDLADLARVGAR